MSRTQQLSESRPVAMILALSGGFMDAYSYVCRNHVFANAQTGNMLLFGVNLSQGKLSASLQYLFPVIAFAFGVAAAELIRYRFNNRKHFHWRQATLLAESAILFTVAFIPQHFNLLANSLLSFACGAQVESFRKVNGSGVATTMCIGNLRSGIQAVCDYGFTKNKRAIENSLLYFIIIGNFVIGAIAGNLFVGMLHEKAILVSVGLLLTDFSVMLFNRET